MLENYGWSQREYVKDLMARQSGRSRYVLCLKWYLLYMRLATEPTATLSKGSNPLWPLLGKHASKLYTKLILATHCRGLSCYLPRPAQNKGIVNRDDSKRELDGYVVGPRRGWPDCAPPGHHVVQK